MPPAPFLPLDLRRKECRADSASSFPAVCLAPPCPTAATAGPGPQRHLRAPCRLSPALWGLHGPSGDGAYFLLTSRARAVPSQEPQGLSSQQAPPRACDVSASRRPGFIHHGPWGLPAACRGPNQPDREELGLPCASSPCFVPFPSPAPCSV